MYGINKFIVNQERNDYSEHLADFDFKLDCSMGSNPYGTWPGLMVTNQVVKELAYYPFSDEPLKEAIAEYFAPMVSLKPSNICLCCGSIGAMLTINRMVLKEGTVILGIAPQFSAVVDDFLTYGASYQPVYLKKEKQYHFDLAEFLAELDKLETAYVYIDNPNNPTGQIVSLADIEKIIQAAKTRDSFVVIDEAYGDYMSMDNSAANLIEKYDNLAVVRTFSKGFGAAGLRLGYILAQDRIVQLLNKVNVPFANNSLANDCALQLLASNWVQQTKERVLVAKQTLCNGGLKVIKMASTAQSTPISLLYCDDEGIDLCQVLEQTGLRAITGAGYEGIGQNSVRLNVHEDMPLLMECLRNAEMIINKQS